MIEVRQNSVMDVWEAYVDGGLYHYDEDLQALPQYLARHADDIRDEMYH